MGSIRASIGLGANLGDPRATLAAARAELARMPRSVLRQFSPLYRSAPIDASGPDFINAVAIVDTELAAQALLAELQRIEATFGRLRPYRNAPRTLDLDLLLYGDACIDTPQLTVPHPRLHRRAFVLRPLADVAPQAVVPGLGPVADLLRGVADQHVERLPP